MPDISEIIPKFEILFKQRGVLPTSTSLNFCTRTRGAQMNTAKLRSDKGDTDEKNTHY